MTSSDIRKHIELGTPKLSFLEFFTAEIAFQLAVANERESEKLPLSPKDFADAYLFYGKRNRELIEIDAAPPFNKLEIYDQRYWHEKWLSESRGKAQDSQNPNTPQD